MKNRLISIFLILNLVACSTITHGTHQKVLVTTSVNGQNLEGVTCAFLTQDSQKIAEVVTPNKVDLPRDVKGIHINCEKDGFIMKQAVDLNGSNHVLGSAGKGAAVGAGGALAASLPLVALPIVGIPLIAILTGIGALTGGVISAGGDAATGGAYALPDHLTIEMISASQNSVNPTSQNLTDPVSSNPINVDSN